MAPRGAIGHDPVGPVAESVDAGAVHRSLSWFKSRPGLHPSPLSQLRLGKPAPTQTPELPVDGVFKALSRLRNLV
jgi:hypothetical protein